MRQESTMSDYNSPVMLGGLGGFDLDLSKLSRLSVGL